MNCKIRLQCRWSLVLACALSAAGAAVPEAVGVKELSQALAYYRAIERLDVDFKQVKSLQDLQLKLESEGHLTVERPGKVVWRVVKPQPMTVELAGQKIEIHSASGDQSFSQSENPSAKDRQSFATLLGWLKLDAAAIAERYAVSKLDLRHYRFVAREKEPMIKSLEMELTPTGQVATLLFQEASGDEMRIQFGKPKVIYAKHP